MIAAADRFDALYDSLFAGERSDWSGPAAAAEVLGYLDELIARAGAAPGGPLLELGCGTGTLSFPLAARGYRVTGLDISARAIAAERARARGTGVAFLQHDISRPRPELSGRFALVVDSLVLHYLTAPADRVGGLRLAADALRPGGALLVITMCGEPRSIPPGSGFDRRTRLLTTAAGVAECHYAQASALGGLFRAAGLRPLYTRLVGGDDTTKAQDLYLAALSRAC